MWWVLDFKVKVVHYRNPVTFILVLSLAVYEFFKTKQNFNTGQMIGQ